MIPLRKLGNSTLTVQVDLRTVAILALTILLTVYYVRQFATLAMATYELVHSIHFNLVAAPFEAAINSARALRDGE